LSFRVKRKINCVHKLDCKLLRKGKHFAQNFAGNETSSIKETFVVNMQSLWLENVKIAKRFQNFYNGEMINFRAASGIFLILAIAFQIGCAGNDPQDANNNANSTAANTNPVTAKDNVEELAGIIKLDIVPEEATYIETNPNKQNSEGGVTGTNEKKLVAVLKYSPEKTAQIIAQAEKYQPAVPAEMSAETWYPEELIAQSQLTGDESIKGSTYAANDFLQAPYSKGKLTKIENTNYFILELTTY
jgi:hypothetical protein